MCIIKIIQHTLQVVGYTPKEFAIIINITHTLQVYFIQVPSITVYSHRGWDFLLRGSYVATMYITLCVCVSSFASTQRV